MAKEKEEKQTKKTKNTEKKVKKEKTNKQSFFKQVKAELKKVKWPTKNEMIKYSIAVIVFIIVFGVYFYGLDALFAWLSSLVKGL